jgi:hypothetical protein
MTLKPGASSSQSVTSASGAVSAELFLDNFRRKEVKKLLAE